MSYFRLLNSQYTVSAEFLLLGNSLVLLGPWHGPSPESNAMLMARKFCHCKQNDTMLYTLQLPLSSHLLKSSSEYDLQNLEGKSLINIHSMNKEHSKEKKWDIFVIDPQTRKKEKKKRLFSAKSLVLNTQLTVF